MRLEPDCVRDILLFIEDMDTYVLDGDGDIALQGAFWEEISEKLAQYPETQIYYTLSKLEEGSLINMTSQWGGGALTSCHVSSLTFEGHEFLENIRDSKRWNIVKNGLSAVRNYSLSVIAAISEGVTSGAVSAYLGGLKAKT